jgi:hypothetical protein
MRLSFDSIEEVKLFVASLKGTRGKKGEDDVTETGNAPAPLAPPAGGSAQGFNPGGMSTAQFAPPAGGAVAGAFPAAAAPDPAIAALVARIVTKLDSAIASGQPADQALAWFKSQCGPETANYTLDQIKQQALPKLAQPVLENMAKLMAA